MMRKTIQNIEFYVNFGLMYMLLIACESDENKVRKRNANIQEVLYAYDTVKTVEGIQYNYNFFKKSKDDEVRLFNEIISDYRENWDNPFLRDKLDSIIEMDSTRHFPELMLQQTYYYYARIEQKFHHPKAAYQLNLKSLEYIKKYPNLFSKQIKSNENLNLKITKSFFHAADYNYRKTLNDYHSDPDNKSKQFGLLYNLAVYAYETKRYKESNEYLKIFFREFPRPRNNKLYPEALSILAWNYTNFQQYDSLKWVDDKALELFNNKEFDTVHYYNFLCHSVDTNSYFLDEKQIKARIDKLLNHYEKNCDRSYSLTLILEAESKLYQKLKKPAKEKESLLQELSFIEFCSDIDDYRLQEKNRIYLRLSKIAILQNDAESTQKWYKKLKELDSMEIHYKNEYIKFSQYLSLRDLQLSKQNFNKYKEDIKNQREIYNLYTVLVVIFIVLVIYLIILYRQNLKNQHKIKEKNVEIKDQNKTISQQNKNLQEIINSLEESNQDLKNFARVAAHDIKSPLATINNGIVFLEQYYESEIKAEHLQHFDSLKNSTEDLAKMINELLNYDPPNKPK